MAKGPDDVLEAPPDFNGPVESRRCTDIFCLVLIMIVWGCMTAVGVIAFQRGDYRLVVYPMVSE